MRKSTTAKWILVITIVGMLGMGTAAMADRGWGPGSGGGGYCGDCPRGYGGGYGKGFSSERGPAWGRNLTDEERQKLEAERDAFFDSTSGLRQSIYQKKLELRAEMAKPSPDAAKAATLQGEISGLKAEMAQKRLEHQLKVKEINPEMGAMMMGKGDGRGGRRGYGGGGCSRR